MILVPMIDENDQLTDGSFVKAHMGCINRFREGKCKSFYDSKRNEGTEGFFKCPCGMTAFLFHQENGSIAFFTCLRNEKYYDKKRERSLLSSLIPSCNPVLSNDECLAFVDNARKALSIEKKEKELTDYYKTFVHEIRSLNGTNKSLIDLLLQENFREEAGEISDDQYKEIKEKLKTVFFSSFIISQKLSLKHIEESYFDRKKATSIVVYKKFDKMAKIYSSSKQHVFINGNSLKEIYTDTYFENIPLLLIDNAVKYSYRHRDVNITFNEFGSTLKVEIESFSPFCDCKEISEITKKGYRGKNASCIAEGSGIGLYLVQLLCERYGIEMKIESVSPSSIDGIQYGYFKVTLLFK
ncbi:hypothetical protein B7990_11160 [Fibrobacter sp. UWB4]|nr:hypothetical protein B7990_11160 [Fibrobacter sp. UWB4]